MKKVIRLTESDLTRIVKRVIKENNLINEIMGSPMVPFYNKYRDRQYAIVFGDKYGKTVTYKFDYYTYVGNPKTGEWKFYESEELFDQDLQHELLNWNSKKWKIVKNPSLIKKLNVEGDSNLKSYNIYYNLSNNPTTKEITNTLRRSTHWLGDDEAHAEAAFMAIDSVKKYNEVKSLLGKDPYQFAKSFMDTSKKYHKIPIDLSMKRLGLLK